MGFAVQGGKLKRMYFSMKLQSMLTLPTNSQETQAGYKYA